MFQGSLTALQSEEELLRRCRGHLERKLSQLEACVITAVPLSYSSNTPPHQSMNLLRLAPHTSHFT